MVIPHDILKYIMYLRACIMYDECEVPPLYAHKNIENVWNDSQGKPFTK